MLTIHLLLLAISAQTTVVAPETPDAHAPAMAKLFPQVEGWKMADAPTQYTPDNLFEYIDGGADAHLQFDFENLATASYVNPRKVEVTVDIYRYRDAARAFGMYTQERPAGTTPLPVGIEGIAGPDYFEFVAGSYYVKLAQAGGKDDFHLRMFAEKIAAKLPGTREPPAVLKCFPNEGKRARAEKLTARNFLGHAFLHDAVAVPYLIDGKQFRLFAVEGKDESDVRNMVQRYSAIAKSPANEPGKTGSMTLNDPLNGEVLLQWSGRRLWGAVDQPSQRRQALVQELGRNLQSFQR